MLNDQESEQQLNAEVQDGLRKEVQAGKDEQGWLKKEMESISEILITRNHEIKDLNTQIQELKETASTHV